MSEMKKFVINCEVCDARKVQEESLSDYERIIINSEVLLVDDRSREILNRLPIVNNTESTLDAEGEVPVMVINGDYELKESMFLGENAVICVNGRVRICQGAGKILDKLLKICINGCLTYTEGESFSMDKMIINGSVDCIPGGYKEMGPVFTIDKYFPIRACQNGKYYVEKEVKLIDAEVDIKTLASKNPHFITGAILLREELLADAVGMFDENTAMEVVPSGYAYVDQDTALCDELLRRYGNRLYIDGNLTLEEGSEVYLGKLVKLKVRGNVYLMKKQEEAFGRINATYQKLVFVKGRHVANKTSVIVDQTMLDVSADGIQIENCAKVYIKEDVNMESAMERLVIENCACVYCSPVQKSTLELICSNVAKITDSEDTEDKKETEKKEKILGMFKISGEDKIVNAETYIL